MENIALQTSWKLEECFMFSDYVQAPQQHVEHPSTQDASLPFPAQQQPVTAKSASPQQPDKSVTNEPQSMHDDLLNNGDSSNNDSPFVRTTLGNCSHSMEGVSFHYPVSSAGGNKQLSQCKSFSVMYFNCRSILPKSDELAALCAANNPDAVAMSC